MFNSQKRSSLSLGGYKIIITRTPCRVTLGGGGTDLPEYYWKHGGFWISAAIDSFIYIAIKPRFEKAIRLAYSKIEEVTDLQQIKHPIFRAALEMFEVENHVEISSLADIPSGTGLGSSGSFTVGLVNTLSAYTKKPVKDLADTAFYIEKSKLGRTVGKQDPYVAMYGGVRAYRVDTRGRITQAPLPVPELDERLVMFYTNIKRDASDILKDVVDKTEYLKQIQNIGEKSWDALDAGEYNDFGELLHQHWLIKREMSPNMTTDRIDNLYKRAQRVGAVGGKLIGAGGGGFLLFYVQSPEAKDKLLKEMRKAKLVHQPFKFHYKGSEVIEF